MGLSLASGTRIGPYEIVAPLGAGGMGEVYRARDARLNRDVALKVLPELFARDPERMARFQREAQVLASLNHPNIAALYGLEESGNLRALVMELVEGATLQGPLPLEEALGVARQMADALEYAHEKGVIHRDLKPANVKVTPDGVVKVLDFGLAILGDGSWVSGVGAATLSVAATREGVILGTAAYMSPEQAKGKPVDRRADIWAFGVVLFEMLTGRKLYGGETILDTLAAVARDEPLWETLPPDTPSSLQHLLRRCLDKDPRRRLQAIGEARLLLEDPLAPAQHPTPKTHHRPRSGLAAALALVALLAAWLWLRAPQPPPRPVGRFTAALSNPGRIPFLTLSRDGSRLAYIGFSSGTLQVYVRPMDQLEAKPISGTDGANSLFFSPDGQWIGYTAGGKMKKVPVTGGASLTLCDSPSFWGADWGPDDTIVFHAGRGAGLLRVSAAGGKPQVLTTLETKRGETGHNWPRFLPGGKAMLFTILTGTSYDDARIAVLDLKTGEKRLLVEGGANARYVPTGHLVYARAAALFAVPFDLDRLRVLGSPVPVLEGVSWSSLNGLADFAFSDAGTLVYVPGGAEAANRTLVWVDRKGTVQPLSAPPRAYLMPHLSPDGQRLAIRITGGELSDIWVYELIRGALTRLTFDSSNSNPIWTPDGKRVTFSSVRSGKEGLFWTPADGSGPPEQLLAAEGPVTFPAWSPDGKVLAFQQRVAGGQFGIWVLPTDGNRKPRPFLQAPFNNSGPQFSPDGRWIAYFSDESGRSQVYVQTYPGPGGKWQISTDVGIFPRWARHGRELFYRNGDKMMAVDVQTSPTFRSGTPQVLWEGRYEGGPHWDVAPDGKRFLMIKGAGDQSAPGQMQVVTEWFDELRRRVPSGGKK